MFQSPCALSGGLALASSAFVRTKPCKQCFCTHKALQAMSLSIQSPLALQELVGQHPKPFNRAAPAGRSTSATRFLLTSTKSLYDTKLLDRDSACLRAFVFVRGCFPCHGFSLRSDNLGGRLLHDAKTKGRCISATTFCNRAGRHFPHFQTKGDGCLFCPLTD